MQASELGSFQLESWATRVVFGRGVASTELADEVDRLRGRRVLIFATPREAPRAEQLARPFAGGVVGSFTGIRPHVPVRVAEAARASAAELGADVLLAIGGGSSIGTAKAVALTSGLPIIAVPTTYAGSEVTPVWGLTDETGKTTGRDLRVLPRTVMYDPDLTLSLPVESSVASGLNAMAHCVEAFWAPGHNPVTDLHADEGIRALAAGLPKLYADGENATGRTEALYGCYLAGRSFAEAGSGLHHKICHVLGGRYDLPHAQTHAVILPHVLAFNAPSVPAIATRIARALTTAGGRGDAVDELSQLIGRLAGPTDLTSLGFDPAWIEQAADAIAPSVPPDNPRRVRTSDLVAILRSASGEDT